MKTVTFGVALALLPEARAMAATPVVEHTPLACVAVDRYARIGARAGAGTTAASAELQFRTTADGAWYAVRMTSSGGEWVAHLPRPARGLGHLEYRIVMTGTDASSSATDPVSVRVADPEECASPTVSSLPMPIAITVPAGAPVVPPVPSGLSPAGVVAAEAAAPRKKGRLIAGAVVGAAVVGATVAGIGGSSGEPPNPPPVPEFSFNGTVPLPGTVLSPVGNPLSILMELTTRPDVVVPLLWRVELAAAGRVCLSMNGLFTVAPGPLSVTLNSLLIAGPDGGCGSSFQTDTVHVTITGQGVLAYDRTHTLPFIFQR